MDQDLRKRFQFFFEHAGYCVGSRAIGAMRLARAERYASDMEWEVIWEGDDCADLGDHAYWCPEAKRAASEGRRPRCNHEVLGAYVRADGEIRASLGGIIDPDRSYRRVIEAELYLEAMPGNPL